MIKLIIFDFDGTIADSKSIYYNAINRQLIPLGFSKKQVDEAIDLGMNLSNTLRRFIPSFFKRMEIREEIMGEIAEEADKVKKCHNIHQIGESHIKRILVSNSLSEFVYPVLKHLHAKKYFSEIYCADDFEDKAKFIIHYMKINGLRAWECFYVGDRIADIKLAKKIGMHNIIISGKCSWDSREELMKAKPEFIVPDISYVKIITEKFRE